MDGTVTAVHDGGKRVTMEICVHMNCGATSIPDLCAELLGKRIAIAGSRDGREHTLIALARVMRFDGRLADCIIEDPRAGSRLVRCGDSSSIYSRFGLGSQLAIEGVVAELSADGKQCVIEIKQVDNPAALDLSGLFRGTSLAIYNRQGYKAEALMMGEPDHARVWCSISMSRDGAQIQVGDLASSNLGR